jgi:hypothetical protein
LALNRRFAASWMALVLFLAAPLAHSQSADTALTLSDAPFANLELAASQNDPAPAVDGGAASQTSPAQPATPQPATPQPAEPQSAEEDKRKKAQEQLEQQEHQRVLGVMATFNTTRNKDALPLTSREKYQLFFKSATDPWPFGLAAFVSGIDQAENSFPQYGQGLKGYAKRYGASYTDYFTGNFFGNAVLPSLLHEDPRYFQKGTGTVTRRILWAAASTVWCKRDDGTWGPNYANVVGNLMGSAVSNLYYPADDRTVKGTIERGVTVSVEGIAGAEVIEFWPDIVRHYRRKQAEKLARQQALKDAPSVSQPAP